MVNEKNLITNTKDEELEEVVLGAILLEDKIYDEISDHFHIGLFTNESHKKLAKIIIQMKNQSKTVDMATVCLAMKSADYFSEYFQPFHVSQLTNRVASTANTHAHVMSLNQLFMKREVVRVSTETIRKATAYHADIFDVIDDAERGISEITGRIVSDNTQTSEEMMKESLERNGRIVELKGKLLGISTGFRRFDELTGGWQNGKLYTGAGDTGMGKTALVFDCALTAALSGVPVGIFNLEMPNIENFMRLQSKLSNVPFFDISNKGVTGERLARMLSKCEPLQKAPVYMDDTPSLTIFQVKNRARKWKRKYGIRMLIIDYLQLIEGERKGNREQEVSSITRNLKSLAKELDIPIIALSQLSRDIKKRANKKPELQDLRESGSIEQDSDMVFFIFRPEYYGITEGDNGEDLTGKGKILIEKHRGGPIGEIKLDWDGPCMRYFSEGMREEVGQGTIIF